jgi:adenylosuccinate lyase
VDKILDPKLYTGRSGEMTARYCGEGGPVQQALAPYMDYIKNAGAVQINV